MIDRAARKQLSERLRHLITGQISNDQFDDTAPRRSQDDAVRAIRRMAWFLYDDMKEYKLKGKHAIPRKGKKAIAVWLLFLRTNLEYEWPRHPGETPLGAIANLATLGLISRLWWNRRWRKTGNYKIWPFIRAKDLRIACRRPILLSGKELSKVGDVENRGRP